LLTLIIEEEETEFDLQHYRIETIVKVIMFRRKLQGVREEKAEGTHESSKPLLYLSLHMQSY